MDHRPPALWKQYGQLLDPQGVEGKISPDLWRTGLARRVFEHRDPAPAAWACPPRPFETARDGSGRPEKAREGCRTGAGAAPKRLRGRPKGCGEARGNPREGRNGLRRRASKAQEGEGTSRRPRHGESHRACRPQHGMAEGGTWQWQGEGDAWHGGGRPSRRPAVAAAWRTTQRVVRSGPTHEGARATPAEGFPSALTARTERSRRTSAVLDAVGELGDLVVDGPPLRHQRTDLPVRVHHRRVVAAAELRPDLGQ